MCQPLLSFSSLSPIINKRHFVARESAVERFIHAHLLVYHIMGTRTYHSANRTCVDEAIIVKLRALDLLISKAKDE
jgi:hypothetical protein